MTDELHVSNTNCFSLCFQSEFLKQKFVFCLAPDGCCSVEESSLLSTYEVEYLCADHKLYYIVIPPDGLKL